MAYDDAGRRRMKWVRTPNKLWQNLPEPQTTPPDVSSVEQDVPVKGTVEPSLGNPYFNLSRRLKKKGEIGEF
jgi:hypothetical protein